nr:MAG TPA: hypothetical protein [Caudoviricetes sp.]DAY03140.1 MAG TPA: hypothetical protein [Caudoviricetes sp.]
MRHDGFVFLVCLSRPFFPAFGQGFFLPVLR